MRVRERRICVVAQASQIDHLLRERVLADLASRFGTRLLIVESGSTGAELLGDVPAELLEGVEIESCEFRNSTLALGRTIAASLTYRFASRSAGYRLKIAAHLLGPLRIRVESTHRALADVTRNLHRLIRRLATDLPVMLVAIWPFSQLAQSYLWHICQRDLQTRRDEGKSPFASCDAVVILMSRQTTSVLWASWQAADDGRATVLVPLKWDNATSKAPLIVSPTRLCVYNENSRVSCIALHRIDLRRIAVIGNPEHPGNFEDRGARVSSQSRQPLVAVLGARKDPRSVDPWIHVVLQEAKRVGFRVWWRPYPTTDATHISWIRSVASGQGHLQVDQAILDRSSHRSHGSVPFAVRQVAYQAYIQELSQCTVVVSEVTSEIGRAHV